MTIYTAIFTGEKHPFFKKGERYEIILAELKDSSEMKYRHALYYKTSHHNIENLLNTWAFITPIKINNNKL